MKRVVQIYRVFLREISEKHISAYAAGTAFFMFLSVIPILLLLCSVIPYTPVTEADLMNMLKGILPEPIVPVAVSIVAQMYDNQATIISFSALTAVWSAAKGILYLIRGLNVINEVKERRNYLELRLEACLYTIFLLFAIVLTLAVMVFGKVFVLTVFFLFLYTFLPGERMKMKTQLPGAVFISVIWSMFSWGFSFYVERFTVFNMYGSLSTLIIVMIWMYVCMYLILFGALVNRFVNGWCP